MDQPPSDNQPINPFDFYDDREAEELETKSAQKESHKENKDSISEQSPPIPSKPPQPLIPPKDVGPQPKSAAKSETLKPPAAENVTLPPSLPPVHPQEISLAGETHTSAKQEQQLNAALQNLGAMKEERDRAADQCESVNKMLRDTEARLLDIEKKLSIAEQKSFDTNKSLRDTEARHSRSRAEIHHFQNKVTTLQVELENAQKNSKKQLQKDVKNDSLPSQTEPVPKPGRPSESGSPKINRDLFNR